MTTLHGQRDMFGNWIGDLKIRGFTSTGTYNDYANCIVQTYDGGFAFGGGTEYDPEVGTTSFGWLVKTDVNGVEQWNQTYADVRIDPVGQWRRGIFNVNALIQAKDGSFVMAGASAEGWQDVSAFIIKTQPATSLPAISSQPNPLPSLPSGFNNSTLTIPLDTVSTSISASGSNLILLIEVFSITILLIVVLVTFGVIRLRRKIRSGPGGI